MQRIAGDPSFDGRTIGVTTLLGTEQAALIYSRIENELGIPFIEKYRVRVGDPATFQGDERDIMFLSMVATPGNAAALSGLPFEQLEHLTTQDRAAPMPLRDAEGTVRCDKIAASKTR